MDDWLPFSYTFLIHSFDFPLGRAENGIFLESIIKNQEDFLFFI